MNIKNEKRACSCTWSRIHASQNGLSADSQQHLKSVSVLSREGWHNHLREIQFFQGEDIMKSPNPGRRETLKIT